MNEVALRIGGRTYRVACAPGEEDRVARLGHTIDEKLASIGNPAGPDAQNLLFAALLLADEVQEGREGTAGEPDAGRVETLTARVAELEDELAGLRASAQGAQQATRDALARQAELEEQLAEQSAAEERLRAEMAESREAQPAPASALSGEEDLGSLAPALESLAQMLEECADKLERRATNA